jgi:hypothetical protein
MLARAAKEREIVLCDRASAVVLYAENRLTRGASDPYTGIGDILGCAGGRVVAAYPARNRSSDLVCST